MLATIANTPHVYNSSRKLVSLSLSLSLSLNRPKLVFLVDWWLAFLHQCGDLGPFLLVVPQAPRASSSSVYSQLKRKERMWKTPRT